MFDFRAISLSELQNKLYNLPDNDVFGNDNMLKSIDKNIHKMSNPVIVSDRYITSNPVSSMNYDWCKLNEFTGTLVFGSEYGNHDGNTTLFIGNIYEKYWNEVYSELSRIKAENRKYYDEIIRMIVNKKSHLRYIESSKLWKQIQEDYTLLQNHEEWNKQNEF